MALTVGDRLGHYDVTAFIGEGGMGRVYRARDTQLNRDVALKVLPDGVATDPERLARFQREARILASLNHPGIAAIYGTAERADVRALVLELVEGPSLADRIGRGPIPVEEALPIARQIAEALEAAHGKGVIHRDLKPANIKVRADGTVKVLDFGLATALESADSDASDSPTVTAVHTRAGVILGTAAYMSPEQARGERVDARSDIWSLGCIIHEMLTGRRPFTGTTVSETLAAILRDEPDWRTLPKDTPAAIGVLLRRCLRKSRDRRLHHVSDVRIELEDAIGSGAEMRATDDGVSARPANRVPRIQQLTANPSQIAVSAAAVSPDGQYLAYSDPTGLYLRVIETGETSPVRLSEDLQFAELAWMPDGTRIIGTGWSGLTESVSLYSISILGGTPRKLRHGWRPAVSPDGTRIAFLSADWPVRAIWTMGADGRDPRQLVAAEEGEQFWQVAWSPDGRRVAYGHSTADGTNAIRSLDVASGQRATLVSDAALFQHWRGILPFVWQPDGRLLFSRRDPPPNQFTSRLWAVDAEPASGSEPAPPREIVGWAGFNLRDIRSTRDGSRLSVLVERNPPSVYVATLDKSGTTLGQPQRLTLDDRYNYPSAWTPEGRAVLFQSNRGVRFELFVQEPGQRVADALVTSPRDKWFPAVSPDGRWLLYQHLVDPIGYAGVMRAPFAGGRVVGPPEDVLGEQSVRFDCGGTRCVLSHADGQDLVFSEFDPLTGRGPELMRHPMGFADPRFANWALSPDGGRVALVNFDDRIQILDLAARSAQVVTVHDWTAIEFVDWAADGHAVFIVGFAANGPRLNNMGLLRVDLSGRVTVLRHEPNEWHVYPVASPDGRHLAFATMLLDSNAWMIDGF